MQWDEFWDGMLANVEHLLRHAAERGHRLTDEQGAVLLHAREAKQGAALTPDVATGLVNLLGALSQQAKPPTAPRLPAPPGEGCDDMIGRCRNYGIVLMALIVPFSLATFISFGLTSLMKKDLDTANSLALSLQGEVLHQVDPASHAAALPPGVTQGEIDEQLQQLETTLRVVYNRAVFVRVLTLFVVGDPFAADATARKMRFQSAVSTADKSPGAASAKIELLTEMAPFAEELIDTVSVMYGAINACILPILYAWLGACAYLLRGVCKAGGETVAIGRKSAIGRLVMAGIGGMVIGFFNNLVVDGGVSVSPFALAFLVGYAIDMFYGVLESTSASVAGTFRR